MNPLQRDATLDEASEAITTLLAHWLDETLKRAVIVTLIDEDCQDPDGNTTCWMAGNQVQIGTIAANILGNLRPMAKIACMQQLAEQIASQKKSGWADGAPGLVKTMSFEEFQAKYANPAADFDDMENIEFEGEDNANRE